MELEALQNLINLQYLSLSQCNVKKLLGSLCLLKNLRMLSLSNCESVGLPENVGDLAHLEKLVFNTCGSSETLNMLPESFCKLPNLKTLSLTRCHGLLELPKGFGSLTNLQNLIIKDTRISYLPDTANLLNMCHQFDVRICPVKKGLYDTVAWLKGLDNLKGTLVILQLNGLPISQNGEDYLNLLSKPNIEKLLLSWEEHFPSKDNKRLEIKTNRYTISVIKDKDLRLLESLQPHPNLKHLGISFYSNVVFPRWMGEHLSCASLKTIHILSCRIRYLHFGNLASLNHLKIVDCDNLQSISHLSLPSGLRSLIISSCPWLLSITGLHEVESLVLVKIDNCKRLKSFSFELISKEHFYKPSSSSSSGLRNLSPAKIVKIGFCPNLQLTENEVVPSADCKVEIYNCFRLQEWCLRHNISYTTMSDWHKFSDSSDEDEDISVDGELNNLGDSKGKQTMEMDEVRSSSSQGIHIPSGQDNLKHMEHGSSSADVMDEDHMEKENSSSDVMDEE